MRLRLIVQRHGLPPVQLLWTVGTANPPKAAPGSSFTISQFLEQVNDIIPLEAEDWGLEDYAVEVRGFECLHFSELNQVLKEDDEVCIRPLQTSDIRVRKFSGRFQISADGKHLMDGVAFGRPFLRKTDRPAVRIPPRKRRKITFDEEEIFRGAAEENDKQIIVRAGFDNTDEGDDEDESEYDEDFDPDEEDIGDLGDEVEGLEADQQLGQGGEGAIILNNEGTAPRTRSRRKIAGLGIELLENGIYSNPLLDHYSQDNGFEGPSALKNWKGRSNSERKDSQSNTQMEPSTSSQHVNRRDSAGSNKSVRFEDHEVATIATPVTIQEFEEPDDEDDDDFEPFNESDKENTQPPEDDFEPQDTSDSNALPSLNTSLTDTSEDDEDETSSSGSSSSDSESSSDSDSDSSSDQLSSDAPAVPDGIDDDDTSSSGSSSLSSRDSKPDDGKQTAQHVRSIYPRTPEAATDEAEKKSIQTHEEVAPRCGKPATRKRNLRRRAQAALKRLKSSGELPQDAKPEDLKRYRQDEQRSKMKNLNPETERLDSLESTSPNETQSYGKKDRPLANLSQQDKHGKFVEKRQALLDSLYSDGGINVTLGDDGGEHVSIGASNKLETAAKANQDKRNIEPISQPELPTAMEQDASTPIATGDDGLAMAEAAGRESIPADVQVPDSLPKEAEPTRTQDTEIETTQKEGVASTPPDASNTPASVPSGSQKRRARLDLAGSKRLLFGSLGLKTPKTKEDESALRAKLMKDVKPVKELRTKAAVESEEAAVQAEDDNNWNEKIELLGVECCHDGIELSTPPFPFVQRWDPTQQGSFKKGRKNKKRKRNDSSYYAEEYPTAASPSKVARQADYDGNAEEPRYDAEAFENDQAHQDQQKRYEESFSTFDQDRTHQDHEDPLDQSFQDSLAANQQLLRENSENAAYASAQAVDQLDLPGLPSDPTTCSLLMETDCSAGAIIAFKRVDMSASTNWQPRITEYVTAKVDDFDADGALHVTLARRDQLQSNGQYNEETGEREYGKFEMPGYDEDQGLDNSKVEIFFNELIEALLIRPADHEQGDGEENQAAQSSENKELMDDTLVGDDAQRAPGEVQAPVSLDTTTGNASNPEGEPTMPTDEARQEITEMIRDAGWRSSLGSGVGKGLDAKGHTVPSTTRGHDDEAPLTFQSPTFPERSSNPPANGHRSEPSQLLAEVDVLQPEGTLQAGVPVSMAHQESGDLNLRSAASASKSNVEYPILPQSNDESQLFQDQRQHRSVSLETNHQETPEDFISPPSQRRRPPKSSSSPTPKSQQVAKPPAMPITIMDGADDSSDEFPELFSQAFEVRMSQEPIIKNEPSQKFNMDKVQKSNSRADGKLSSSQKSNVSVSWNNCRNDSGSWKTELSGFDEEDNDSSFHPSQSQVQQSSQVVDVTISSDVYDENEGDSSYKSLSGWVDKPTANRAIGVTKSCRRTTRSRS